MKKIFIVAICFTITYPCVFAQKLPDIQQKSSWANHIKIDGKIEDWGTNLQAYNKETQLWYSIANDDKYLYLAIKKDKNPGKITSAAGALKFFVDKNNLKDTISLPAITFPVNRKGIQGIPDSEWADMFVQNIDGITDNKVSIYNEYGIMVGWHLDKDGRKPILYTYELAIPLKLLKITLGQAITYHILLRGIRPEKPLAKDKVSPLLYAIPHPSTTINEEMRQAMIDEELWTSLTAKYTLVSKP